MMKGGNLMNGVDVIERINDSSVDCENQWHESWGDSWTDSHRN